MHIHIGDLLLNVKYAVKLSVGKITCLFSVKRPHECKICDKTLRQLDHLKKHLCINCCIYINVKYEIRVFTQVNQCNKNP